MAFKIKDLHYELGEVIETVGEIMGNRLIEESEKEYRIYCATSCYHLPKLKINVHYAELLIYNEDEKEYMIEDKIYFVFDYKKKKLVYSEQGGSLQTCIHNYCSIVLKDKNITMEKVENYDCIYTLDKGSLLDSYGKYILKC